MGARKLFTNSRRAPSQAASTSQRTPEPAAMGCHRSRGNRLVANGLRAEVRVQELEQRRVERLRPPFVGEAVPPAWKCGRRRRLWSESSDVQYSSPGRER